MTDENTPSTADNRPAVGVPVQRGVRAPHPEREDFESWWCRSYHPAKLARMEADGGYIESTAAIAWSAWQQARPRHAHVGAIYTVAADLAQRKPLAAFDELAVASHIGHRQFARAYARADESVRLLACKLADAVRAL